MVRRLLILMGTRPEAIKLAPVIAAFEGDKRFSTCVVNTGQHRELIDQVIERFGLRVDRDLAVMRPDQSLASLTARLTSSIDDVLLAEQPDMTLVQGDTTTVLAGALASFYRRTPVAHVEAGLRTGDLTSPFPEEANRRLTTTVAALHFAPTERSQENLLAERVDPGTIHVTGNTVIDALRVEDARQESSGERAKILAELELESDKFVLITGHRRENFGRGFDQITTALKALAERFSDLKWVYPVHLNPRVKDLVHERLSGVGNVVLMAPQPYDRFVALLSGCRLVLTDSGGVQEEAPSFGKPVLVMRDTTERPEGVAAGTVKLVGTDSQAIIDQAATLLTDSEAYSQMANAVNPYGDGNAAGRIVRAVADYLGQA